MADGSDDGGFDWSTADEGVAYDSATGSTSY